MMVPWENRLGKESVRSGQDSSSSSGLYGQLFFRMRAPALDVAQSDFNSTNVCRSKRTTNVSPAVLFVKKKIAWCGGIACANFQCPWMRWILS
jgi:hypothetical protein